MAEDKRVLCRAKVRCQNPVTRQYTYPGDEDTFTIGPGGFKDIPKHWEAVPVNKKLKLPHEAETLLEMQIKGMSSGRIAQYLMIFYGVKIDLGQAHETAFQEAIGIIRDPAIKRRPDSEIAAGLATIENDTPQKEEEKGPGPIPSGQAAPVVPAKDAVSNSEPSSNENAAASGEKLFGDLNPDEIDDLSRDDIFAKVKRMYQVELANAGNKTVVLNKAYEIETAALEALAVKQ